MIATITKIGNSQGIRIPKKLLQAQGITLGQSTEIVEHPEGLLLKPVRVNPRADWAAQFAAEGKSTETVEYLSTEWDNTEWTW